MCRCDSNTTSGRALAGTKKHDSRDWKIGFHIPRGYANKNQAGRETKGGETGVHESLQFFTPRHRHEHAAARLWQEIENKRQPKNVVQVSMRQKDVQGIRLNELS